MVAQIDHLEPTEEQLELAVETLKLLADRTRLQIVWALLHGEHSVTELAHHVGVNPAGVSQHLAKLRLARLVTVRREGTKAYYAAENIHVRELAEQALFHVDHLAGAPGHSDEPEPSAPTGGSGTVATSAVTATATATARTSDAPRG